jgi:hypothetical protein
LDILGNSPPRGEENIHGKIDGINGRLGRRLTISQNKLRNTTLILGNGVSDNRETASFSSANACEAVESIPVDKEYVSLLGLVAPNLERRHGVISAFNLSKLELATKTSVLNELGQSVRKTTSANIVDECDGTFRAKSDTGVDDHLGSSFHLRVSSLDTVKVKICGSLTTSIGGSSATTETDQHGGTTKNNDMGTLFNMALLLKSVLGSNAANTTGDHDGLVVTSVLRGIRSSLVGKKCPERSGQGRATELVIEAGRSNRGL